jgi:phosphomannomutase
MEKIRFGTDGWRGVFAKDFTFENLRRVAAAHSQTLEPGNQVLIGYDSRFMSEEFALAAAQAMQQRGVDASVTSEITPTPALSFAVRQFGMQSGVMITASHNPSNYNGYKIKGNYGGSASPEMVAAVETQLISPLETHHTATPPVPRRHVREAYYQQLCNILDLPALRSYQGKWFHDAMGGAGAGWLQGFVEYAKLPLDLVCLRSPADPLFYHSDPEPIAKNLMPLQQALKHEQGSVFGVATDGDADRLGAVTAGGEFFNSHQIFVVLLAHLARKGLSGRVVKTVSTSGLVDLLAKQLGMDLLETPIGFKYIIKAFLEGNVLIGGEESGGLAVCGHIPERDGLLNSLLLLESVIYSGLSLTEQFKQIEQELGFCHAYDRLDLHLQQGFEAAKFLQSLQQQTQFLGETIIETKSLDGVKWCFADSSWLMFRASGTEPLLRIYCEAQSQSAVSQKIEAAQAHVVAWANHG